jgi:high-affinity iron transporter
MATTTPARRPCAALPAVLALLVLVGRPATGAAAGGSHPDTATVQRILVLLSAVGGEYREGLDEKGAVVRPIELDEARLLLREARQHVDGLGDGVPAELASRIEGLTRAIDARSRPEEVEAQVDAARDLLSRATGVAPDVLPPAPPSAARGQAVFLANCSGCHGEHGAGDGPQAVGLERKPANFTDPIFMRGETPSDFFHVVSVGKRLGAMPAWGDVLSVQERWDAVAYVWSLSGSAGAVAEGQGVFLAHCAGCHGAAGDGHGALAPELLSPIPDLSQPGRLAGRSDEELFATVSEGIHGAAMPAFARTLTEVERWRAVAFLRLLSLGGPARAADAASAADAGGVEASGALAETRRLLDASVDAARRGDPSAASMATDAYFRFEPLEPRLRAIDPDVVRNVEEGFLRLRTAMQDSGAQDLTPLAVSLHRDLEIAGRALEPTVDAYARFAQSAMIILREGFEIVLIIGALLAYVRRSGHADMARPIHLGTGLGVIASLATAAVLTTLLRLHPGASDVLEGGAMLLAAVVLFWVSYWIVSKAEAERWQRYIQGKVQHALAAGSTTTLAAAAFLAVYREGFETVLFYQALIGSAPEGDFAVGGGFAVGALALAVVYVLFNRFGRRIPIRPFFLGTGALLYAMAVIFAGKGVHELQEAAVVTLTPVAWGPRVELLGVFPTVESLAAQGVLLACLVYGLVVTLRRAAKRRAEGMLVLRDELRRLCEQAEAMRAEVAGLRAVDAVASAGIGARLDGLIGRVRDLEARVRPSNGRA